MTFARIVFAFALLMLVVGIIGSRYISEVVFAPLAGSAGTPIAVASHAATPRSSAAPTATPTPTIVLSPAGTPSATPQPTATRSPTITPVPLPTRVLRPSGRRLLHHKVKPRRTPVPTATMLPSPTATTGTVALARYWVGSQLVRDGQTVSIGYVIDNQTGHTARVLLGASIKGSRALSWSAGLSDPYHDVVAIVPPGVSTHVRYFSLPAGLHPGAYDVAWGLRSAGTGQRDALVTAYSALQVTR